MERGQEPLKREEAERIYEKPIFTQLLTGPAELIEGQHAHFECRVVPVGDPTLRFEWYVNGVELKMGKFSVNFIVFFFNLEYKCCKNIKSVLRKINFLHAVKRGSSGHTDEARITRLFVSLLATKM